MAAPPLPTVDAIIEAFLPQVDPDQTLAMTTPAERAYCRWAAETYFSGAGRVIELGCWLGSLTRPLAGGLLANRRIPPAARRVHGFDQFLWMEEWQDLIRGTRLEGRVAPGQDYLALYLERVAELRDLVEVTTTDLRTFRYSGEAIELLVVDVMKSFPLTKNIAEQFFPSLIPGRALVLNQDYFHFGHPWIHVAAYRLRDSLRLVHAVPSSCMAVFQAIAEPRVDGLASRPEDEPLAAINEAYRWNRSITPTGVHDTLAAAEVQLLLHRGDHERAEELYRNYTAGAFRYSLAFRQLYEHNKRGGLIAFDDPYYDAT